VLRTCFFLNQAQQRVVGERKFYANPASLCVSFLQAKCMISEAHHSFYDPWTQSVHEWCRHYYGVLGFTARWMNYHFLPCLVKNCPRHHESNLKGKCASRGRVSRVPGL
jgi:hypothetical protein